MLKHFKVSRIKYLILALTIIAMLFTILKAHSQILESLSETPDEVVWFQTQQIRSCCNLGDAFVSDDFYTDKDGNYHAILLDGINHATEKQEFPVGFDVIIKKVTLDKNKDFPDAVNRNPTGHGIVFMKQYVPDGPINIYCYFPPALL